MITRIVRMHFQPELVDAFLNIFNSSKRAIRYSPGCLHLELMRDAKDPTVFFTYSSWENELALENYRQSELFNTTWSKTKLLFSAKPLAYSLKSLEVID